MTSEGSGVLSDLAPVFRPYLQNVYQDLKLGLCKHKVDFERISGNSEGGESQFRLVLPYCSKKLKWEVLFDTSSPWFAPDFRFDDDSFLMSVDENFLDEKVPSLSKWNESDPKALSNVILELINLFKLYQVKKLNEDESSRAYFEYSALLGDALTSENDVEVWVGSHVVEFLIRLNVDTSKLPELYNDGPDSNPGIDNALLLVRYPNSTNAELILSPLLSKSLGIITLPLTAYVIGENNYTEHSAAELKQWLCGRSCGQNILKIQDLLNNEKLKRDLLAQLIVKYEGAVLEHDANNAAFLFEMNDFHWILQIDIGLRFPEKPPVLTIRSVYHCSKGKPKSKVLPAYPYNNFETLRTHIEQQVEIFKTECMGMSSNNQIVNLDN